MRTRRRCFLDRRRGNAGAAQVLVHEIQQHGGHVVLAALVPVAVDGQPVAQVPHLLPCKALHILRKPISSPQRMAQHSCAHSWALQWRKLLSRRTPGYS